MRQRLVNFRIHDVYHPDPNHLLRELHGEDLLQGTVLDVSQGSGPGSSFAVVEVEGLRQPVVVPLKGILEIL